MSALTLGMVVPVHDVSTYLPDFLDSLDRQPRGSLPEELIFIDDGSTDGSGEIVRAWIDASRHVSAQLVRTENGGVSRARNAGLDLATADWIGFLDPDDVLGDDYFVALRAMLSRDDSVDLVAANLLRIVEPDLAFRNAHQLRFRFAGGSRTVELAGDMFVMNAASVVFPLAPLRAHGIRFAEGLHASEDALFVAAYLQTLGRTPRAGLAAEARYGYRKRAAQTSAVDRYRADPDSYILRFRDGYHPLLEQAAPDWLQAMFVYELQWILPTQLSADGYADLLSDDQRAEVLEALASCLRHVDERVLLTYDATALPLESRLLALALAGKPLWNWVGAYATRPRGWRDRADVIVYERATDGAPVALDDADAEVAWFPDYFGQQVLRARHVRVSRGISALAIGRERRRIVWPLPGESLSQTQDRHRRRELGIERLAIPANEIDVVVRAVPVDAPAPLRRAVRRFVRRERSRRVLWSKDSVIGRLFRPGRGWQIRHDPTDAGQTGLRLYRHMKHLEKRPPIWLVDDGTGASLSGADRFGSVSYRVRRVRAAVIFSASASLAPSPRARVRGVRVLLVPGVPGRLALAGVRRFAPDHVIVHSEQAKQRLSRVGMLQEDVTVVTQGDVAAIANTLTGLSGGEKR